MFRILNLKEPSDFIIATGHKHTIGDVVEIAFGAVDLG
jgi:GDP-D-mannose dehydratase